MRSYVIGDIHGCVDGATYLDRRFAACAAAIRWYFSAITSIAGRTPRVSLSYLVDLYKTMAAIDLVFFKGNHEDMFLSYLGLGRCNTAICF